MTAKVWDANDPNHPKLTGADPKSVDVGGAGFKASWGMQDVNDWIASLLLLNQGYGQVQAPRGGIGIGASFGSGSFGNGGAANTGNNLPNTMGPGGSGINWGALAKNPTLWKALLAGGTAFGGAGQDNSIPDPKLSGSGKSSQGKGTDLDALYKQLFGGGKNKGGGGGGSNVNPLNDIYANLPNIGNFDPALMDNILGIQGQGTGTYNDFNSMINMLGAGYSDEIGGNDIIAALMGDLNLGGGGSGGGGGSFRFSGGGGGGVNQSTIAQLLSELPEFQARDIRSGLPTLSPEISRQLDTVKESQLADFENLRSNQNDELLTKLFGSGTQRSTVAGDVGNRLNESLDRTKLQVLSEDVSRRLGIQKDEADRILAGDLGSLSADSAAYGNLLSAITGIRTQEIGSDASLRASQAASAASAAGAAASASAALSGDRLRALASIYGSRTSALSNVFNTQAGSLTSGFGDQMGSLNNFANLFGEIGLGTAGLDVQKNLGIADLFNQQGIANANRSASVGNANRQAKLDWAKLMQSGDLAREGFDLERELALLGANTQTNLANADRPSTWDRIIAAMGPAAAAYFGSK